MGSLGCSSSSQPSRQPFAQSCGNYIPYLALRLSMRLGCATYRMQSIESAKREKGSRNWNLKWVGVYLLLQRMDCSSLFISCSLALTSALKVGRKGFSSLWGCLEMSMRLMAMAFLMMRSRVASSASLVCWQTVDFLTQMNSGLKLSIIKVLDCGCRGLQNSPMLMKITASGSAVPPRPLDSEKERFLRRGRKEVYFLTVTQFPQRPRQPSILKGLCAPISRPAMRPSHNRKPSLDLQRSKCRSELMKPECRAGGTTDRAARMNQSLRVSLKQRELKRKQPESKGLFYLDKRGKFHLESNRSRLGKESVLLGTVAGVKAVSYIVCGADLSCLLKHNAEERRQIASLTKIFTCYCSLLLLAKYEVDPMATAKVSERASSMKGTTASLRAGDILLVDDLLFGMMLPSGNDAAYALAQFCGQLIHVQMAQKNAEVGKLPPKRCYVRIFLGQLNRLVKQMGLENTWVANPHGLMNRHAFSTAQDVAFFCGVAMRHPKFARLVATKEHRCSIRNHRTGLRREVSWANTNRLLQKEGYFGIKTGVTPAAGPCFAGKFEVGGLSIVTVLLGTASCGYRFRDTELLVREVADRLRGVRVEAQEWSEAESGEEQNLEEDSEEDVE